MKKLLLIFPALLMFLTGCGEDAPLIPEGDTSYELNVFWHTVPADTTSELVPMGNATVIFSSEYGIQTKTTDQNGYLKVEGLPSSVYSISCRMYHPADSSIQLVYNEKDVAITSGNPVTSTAVAEPISSTGIAINEIYCGGPLNNMFFFYDQYIELYNLSDSTKYLDGMMVMRFSGNNDGKGPGADEFDDGNIYGAVYIFKFPGSPGEENYPFPPKTFLVLASDAVNHTNTLSNSVDLSNADWEFYNQFSTIDIDNPSVPNLLNMRSESTVDFLINLVSDVIILASGEDSVYTDGIDINTVIDGVEYQSNPNSRKTLDDRIDRGYVISPPRYSGQSMQRRTPGGDTNDGTLDWETTPYPTPGYHYK